MVVMVMAYQDNINLRELFHLTGHLSKSFRAIVFKREHLSEKTGSIKMFAWFPLDITAVEWPIQVYLN